MLIQSCICNCIFHVSAHKLRNNTNSVVNRAFFLCVSVCVHQCTIAIRFRPEQQNPCENSFSVSLQVQLCHIEKCNCNASICDRTSSLSRFSIARVEMLKQSSLWLHIECQWECLSVRDSGWDFWYMQHLTDAAPELKKAKGVQQREILLFSWCKKYQVRK